MANLRPHLEQQIEEAIQTASPQEEVDFTANFAVMGSPTGEPVTVLLLLLHMRDLAIDEWITSVVWIPSARPNAEQVSDAVRQGVGQMRDARNKRTQEALGTSEGHGHGHGHELPASLRGAINLGGGLPPR
jgi:hypothetical protein